MSEGTQVSESAEEKPKIQTGPLRGTFVLQRGEKGQYIRAKVFSVPDETNVNDDRPFVVTNPEGTEEYVLDLDEREVMETSFLGKPRTETLEALEKRKIEREKRIKASLPSRR